MRKVLLVRYGEVFLKGANRPHFLKLLTDNVKRAVKPIGGKVWLSDSRIYVSDVEDMDECVRRVRKVFGLYSVSPAIECEKDLDVIAEQCIEMMKGKRGSFKVYGKRSDKKFPMNSLEFAAELGGRILESNPHLTVDIHNPQHKLRVEIRDNCYGAFRLNWTSLILFALFAALAALVWLKKDGLKLEYDYALEDGTLDVTAILNARRRKVKLTLPLSGVQSCGDVDSAEYRRISSRPGLQRHKLYLNEAAPRCFFLYSTDGAQHLAVLELNPELRNAVRGDRRLPLGSWHEGEGTT